MRNILHLIQLRKQHPTEEIQSSVVMLHKEEGRGGEGGENTQLTLSPTVLPGRGAAAQVW